jgi:hypothetical protein
MANHLVTLFDANYLARGLALYESGMKHVPECEFWCLCLDDESMDLLKKMGLPYVHAFSVADMKNSALEVVRSARTRGEFAFTSKSNFLRYLVDSGRFADGEVVLWADADILFYSSAERLVDEVRKHSIVITPHKFPPEKEYMNDQVGKYNAGMVFFTIDANSKACIREWADQCIEWCYHRLEDGKLGDQLYLNDWSRKYAGVYELPDKGVNAGTWNILRYEVRKDANGLYTLDGEPLVCYHFHGLKVYEADGRIRSFPLTDYHSGIYGDYCVALTHQYDRLRRQAVGFDGGISNKPDIVRLAKQRIQSFLRKRAS